MAAAVLVVPPLRRCVLDGSPWAVATLGRDQGRGCVRV